MLLKGLVGSRTIVPFGLSVSGVRDVSSASASQSHAFQRPMKSVNLRKYRASVVTQAMSKTKKSKPTYNDIKVSEARDGSRVRLTVEVPPEVVSAAYKATLDYIRTNTKIDTGFRPGKTSNVPEFMIVQHVGGQKNANKFACEEILNKTIPVALKPYEATAVDDSQQVETPIEKMVEAFDLTKSLTYTVSVDIYPKVQWKADPKTIAVEVEAAGDDTTVAKRVDALIANFLKSQGTLKVATGRGASETDVLVIDFDCTNKANNQPLPGARRRNWQFDLALAEDFVPGLRDGMLGVKVGEERSIPVKFPANWPTEYLRGVDAVCDVKISEVFEWQLPELTDAIVGKMDPRAHDVKSLREILTAQVEQQVQEETAARVRDAFAVEIVKLADVPLPQSMLESFAATEYEAEIISMIQRGVLTSTQASQLMNPQGAAAFLKNKREEVEEGLRLTLAVEALADQLNIVVDEAELDSEVKAAKVEARVRGEEFDEAKTREELSTPLRGIQVNRWLMENCKVTIKPYQGK